MTGKTMFTTLTTQDNSVATSEHGFRGVQLGLRGGLEDLSTNSEMGVLSTFSVMGAAAGFDQRRLGKGDSEWEAYGYPVVSFSESIFVAKDGGCEVMTAQLFKWGFAVKRRGEVRVCWLPEFGRKAGFASAVNSPLSHLFLTSPKEQNAPIRSGAAQRGRMRISGPGGNDIAPGSLHPSLGPQLWQSGTMTYNSSAKRRRGADLLDVGVKRVAHTGASSGQKPGRQTGALNKGLCQVGVKMGADSTRTKRGLSGKGFVRQNPDRGRGGH